jgi:ubiquitin C-terminal hydrolase
MNPSYNYLNSNQSYYQQNMNNMYQGQNGNFNQQINNGQMMNYNQNTPYMNQMNYSNNLLYNQNQMNNNRSRSHNAYFVSRFGQNNFNNNMFNNPTFYNNNMSNNLNNMNSFTNNMPRYNNIGSINNSNNFNNMNNNNNIASYSNNGFYNNINSYNNCQNINSMNSFNNNTMNNNNTLNNMNSFTNNAAMSNINNINNTNNTGKKYNNATNIFNPQTMIINRNKNNKNIHNQQRRNYDKRDSNANKNHVMNNISTFKNDYKDYSKRIIEENISNDITTNKNDNKNISNNKNLKNENPNFNDQLKQNEKNDIKKESLTNDNKNSQKDSYNDKQAELKQIKDKIEEKPSEEEDLKLNALIKARGLQNVGATCYMNATLQCLYHVKQLSEALVNDDKIDEKLELTYSFKKLIEGLAFTNLKKFKIDRRYNRVTGENIKSFKPENFKEVLSKKNPLFKGIKANDSKDLIIYLFQEMDKELTLRNNNSETMKMFIGNNESETEKENFKEYHNSIFGDLFYGFQKTDMICYDCRNCNSTYNVFNNLILPIEKTYNSLNDENKKKNRNNNAVNMFNPQTCQTFNRRPGLSSSVNYNYGYNNYNNFNSTPDLPRKLTVYDCLKELLKDEILSGDNQIYCNKCRKMCISINRTTLYKTPNILILILNRGKGNSFDCEIEFSKNLDLSRYNIINKDSPKQYELFGVISHIGESSDEGHFIAYCKHFDDNWYMFNDSIAKTVGENELTNGVPYILFYRNINIDKEFGN